MLNFYPIKSMLALLDLINCQVSHYEYNFLRVKICCLACNVFIISHWYCVVHLQSTFSAEREHYSLDECDWLDHYCFTSELIIIISVGDEMYLTVLYRPKRKRMHVG